MKQSYGTYAVPEESLRRHVDQNEDTHYDRLEFCFTLQVVESVGEGQVRKARDRCSQVLSQKQGSQEQSPSIRTPRDHPAQEGPIRWRDKEAHDYGSVQSEHGPRDQGEGRANDSGRDESAFANASEQKCAKR